MAPSKQGLWREAAHQTIRPVNVRTGRRASPRGDPRFANVLRSSRRGSAVIPSLYLFSVHSHCSSLCRRRADSVRNRTQQPYSLFDRHWWPCLPGLGSAGTPGTNPAASCGLDSGSRFCLAGEVRAPTCIYVAVHYITKYILLFWTGLELQHPVDERKIH